MAESTDMEVGWRADVANMFIKIEMFVKSDTKYLDVVYRWNRCTHNLDGSSIEKRLESWAGAKANYLSFSWI